MLRRIPLAFAWTALAVLAAPVAPLPLVTAPASLAHEYAAKGVSISHPWARATPKGAKVGAAYLEIKTDAKTSDRLLGARTAVAGKVEIHTHIHEGGVMKMRQIPGIDLAAGVSHVLKPSGDHVMLMDLKQPLKEGDLLKLTLVFEKAGEIEVEATVEALGAKGPHGMDHQPGHEGMDHSKMDHSKPAAVDKAPAAGHRH